MSKILTVTDLAAIEALVSGATEGPLALFESDDDLPHEVCLDPAMTDGRAVGRFQAMGDAELFFHARTDLHRAVDTIRALAEAIRRIEDVEGVCECYPWKGTPDNPHRIDTCPFALARLVLGDGR